MKIAVLNGSPKGAKSVTMQYVARIRKELPEHEWAQFDIGPIADSLETDAGAFDALAGSIRGCDAVLWAFPVYHMTVSSQLKRFIELVFSRGAKEAFEGKYAAALATSIHFFDHTAMNYIRAVSEDLGMNFTLARSHHMNDILEDRTAQHGLADFARAFIRAAGEKEAAPRVHRELIFNPSAYAPGTPALKTPLNGKRAAVIFDGSSANAESMARRFASSLEGDVSLTDLREVDTRGGCLGCMRCAPDNNCAWDGRDGFRTFFESVVLASDIIVLAGGIRDRFLSWRFKRFFDRSFFMTHQPYFRGKQVAWLVSGPLSQDANMRQVMESYADFMGGNNAGIMTDESGDSLSIDAGIDSLARNAAHFANRGYISPRTFLGVSGKNIFRDEIYGNLRLVFQGDHRYYRRNGWYDFPQKKIGQRILQALLWPIMRLPPVRKAFSGVIKEGMLMPYLKGSKD